MGKGQIVSGGTDGQYQVKLIYAYRSRVEQKILKMQQNITSIEGQIITLDAQIAVETDIKKKESLILRRSVLNLQKTSIQKQIAYYQNNMPADPTVSAWCMDLTEDLSGNVGTAEIPGEPSLILIRPGYSGKATYSGTRDGQLMPSIAGEPNQVLFNWMILPGWQRHNPIYRVGTIAPDSIDFDSNTCSVCLDTAYSSQQSLPAIDGATVSDCNMGNDTQSNYLTSAANDFCSRNPSHPFCTQSSGSEINLTDAMLAQLKGTNLYVNLAYGRQNDKSGIIAGDSWDVMDPGGSGDCEDFALTKMQKLVDDYGWNPDNLKMVTAYAKNGEYHAMLGVRTTNRGLVILDNNYNEVMESGRVPYRIDKIALTSNNWKNYARRIDNVPIEYMTCNASAFADNDRVIVEFTNQSWDNAKVIGFLENPNQCEFDGVWVMGNGTLESYSWSFLQYSIAADAWNASKDIPGPNYEQDGYVFDQIARYRCFSSDSGQSIFLFGGLDWNQNPNMNIMSRSDKYIKANGTWSSIQDMTSGRANGQGIYLSGKSYVIGGSDLFDNYPARSTYYQFYYWPTGSTEFDTNFQYDENTNSWAMKQSAPSGKFMSRQFVIGAIGYRILGRNNPYVTTQVEPPIFDTTLSGYSSSTDSWSEYQNLIRGRHYSGSCNINGNGFIGGGNSDIGQTGDNYDGITYGTTWIEKYNPNANSWSYFANQTPYETPSSGNMVGKTGFVNGYAHHNNHWNKIDSIAETLTILIGRTLPADDYDLTAEVY